VRSRRRRNERRSQRQIRALIAPAWLVARALPNRPALTGALCGLAVGGMGDAGLRLFCWDGGYSHVMFAHGGAIAILVAMGALSALLVERWKDPGKKR